MEDLIGKAIISINPNAEFTFKLGNIDSIVWNNDTTPISKEDIQAKMSEIEQRETDKKESGKQKLKDLGLDDEEIKQLMGV
tara:strand:- start:127 stop:369 length:243 start_codon:yes stop_codon:yes gene_type:complete